MADDTLSTAVLPSTRPPQILPSAATAITTSLPSAASLAAARAIAANPQPGAPQASPQIQVGSKNYNSTVQINGQTFYGTPTELQAFVKEYNSGSNPPYFAVNGKNYVSSTGAEYAQFYSNVSPTSVPNSGGYQLQQGNTTVYGTQADLSGLIRSSVQGQNPSVYQFNGLNFASPTTAAQYLNSQIAAGTQPYNATVRVNGGLFQGSPAQLTGFVNSLTAGQNPTYYAVGGLNFTSQSDANNFATAEQPVFNLFNSAPSWVTPSIANSIVQQATASGLSVPDQVSAIQSIFAAGPGATSPVWPTVNTPQVIGTKQVAEYSNVNPATGQIVKGGNYFTGYQTEDVLGNPQPVAQTNQPWAPLANSLFTLVNPFLPTAQSQPYIPPTTPPKNTVSILDPTGNPVTSSTNPYASASANNSGIYTIEVNGQQVGQTYGLSNAQTIASGISQGNTAGLSSVGNFLFPTTASASAFVTSQNLLASTGGGGFGGSPQIVQLTSPTAGNGKPPYAGGTLGTGSTYAYGGQSYQSLQSLSAANPTLEVSDPSGSIWFGGKPYANQNALINSLASGYVSQVTSGSNPYQFNPTVGLWQTDVGGQKQYFVSQADAVNSLTGGASNLYQIGNRVRGGATVPVYGTLQEYSSNLSNGITQSGTGYIVPGLISASGSPIVWANLSLARNAASSFAAGDSSGLNSLLNNPQQQYFSGVTASTANPNTVITTSGGDFLGGKFYQSFQALSAANPNQEFQDTAGNVWLGGNSFPSQNALLTSLNTPTNVRGGPPTLQGQGALNAANFREASEIPSRLTSFQIGGKTYETPIPSDIPNIPSGLESGSAVTIGNLLFSSATAAQAWENSPAGQAYLLSTTPSQPTPSASPNSIFTSGIFAGPNGPFKTGGAFAEQSAGPPNPSSAGSLGNQYAYLQNEASALGVNLQTGAVSSNNVSPSRLAQLNADIVAYNSNANAYNLQQQSVRSVSAPSTRGPSGILGTAESDITSGINSGLHAFGSEFKVGSILGSDIAALEKDVAPVYTALGGKSYNQITAGLTPSQNPNGPLNSVLKPAEAQLGLGYELQQALIPTSPNASDVGYALVTPAATLLKPLGVNVPGTETLVENFPGGYYKLTVPTPATAKAVGQAVGEGEMIGLGLAAPEVVPALSELGITTRGAVGLGLFNLGAQEVLAPKGPGTLSPAQAETAFGQGVGYEYLFGPLGKAATALAPVAADSGIGAQLANRAVESGLYGAGSGGLTLAQGGTPTQALESAAIGGILPPAIEGIGGLGINAGLKDYSFTNPEYSGSRFSVGALGREATLGARIQTPEESYYALGRPTVSPEAYSTYENGLPTTKALAGGNFATKEDLNTFRKGYQARVLNTSDYVQPSSEANLPMETTELQSIQSSANLATKLSGVNAPSPQEINIVSKAPASLVDSTESTITSPNWVGKVELYGSSSLPMFSSAARAGGDIDLGVSSSAEASSLMKQVITGLGTDVASVSKATGAGWEVEGLNDATSTKKLYYNGEKVEEIHFPQETNPSIIESARPNAGESRFGYKLQTQEVQGVNVRTPASTLETKLATELSPRSSKVISNYVDSVGKEPGTPSGFGNYLMNFEEGGMFTAPPTYRFKDVSDVATTAKYLSDISGGKAKSDVESFVDAQVQRGIFSQEQADDILTNKTPPTPDQVRAFERFSSQYNSSDLASGVSSNATAAPAAVNTFARPSQSSSSFSLQTAAAPLSSFAVPQITSPTSKSIAEPSLGIAGSAYRLDAPGSIPQAGSQLSFADSGSTSIRGSPAVSTIAPSGAPSLDLTSSDTSSSKRLSRIKQSSSFGPSEGSGLESATPPSVVGSSPGSIVSFNSLPFASQAPDSISAPSSVPSIPSVSAAALPSWWSLSPTSVSPASVSPFSEEPLFTPVPSTPNVELSDIYRKSADSSFALSWNRQNRQKTKRGLRPKRYATRIVPHGIRTNLFPSFGFTAAPRTSVVRNKIGTTMVSSSTSGTGILKNYRLVSSRRGKKDK